ncbi:MAG: hypothetical protein LBH02_00305 [Methanocalculaceae archaeon]|nr:hypothetical protein [Methanocalculaceae archaeon]
MFAHVGPKTVAFTKKTGFANYHNCSQQRLWKKDEESCHLQKSARSALTVTMTGTSTSRNRFDARVAKDT